jgi:hypothetical protein
LSRVHRLFAGVWPSRALQTSWYAGSAQVFTVQSTVCDFRSACRLILHRFQPPECPDFAGKSPFARLRPGWRALEPAACIRTYRRGNDVSAYFANRSKQLMRMARGSNFVRPCFPPRSPDLDTLSIFDAPARQDDLLERRSPSREYVVAEMISWTASDDLSSP